jgi:uncharacterized protein
MPGAGFYTIHNSRIRFGRDGVWYADDEPIDNERIAHLFSRHVRRRAGGGYELEIGPERAPIEVDDTPYVVVGVDAKGGSMEVELNDGSRERLDPCGLEVGGANVLYCRVKGGTERARFLRTAYYQIAPNVSEREAGRFVLRVGENEYPIR